MMSNPPMGHYRNVIAAAKDMAHASDAVPKIVASAAHRHHQAREERYKAVETTQRMKDGAAKHASSLPPRPAFGAYVRLRILDSDTIRLPR